MSQRPRALALARWGKIMLTFSLEPPGVPGRSNKRHRHQLGGLANGAALPRPGMAERCLKILLGWSYRASVEAALRSPLRIARLCSPSGLDEGCLHGCLLQEQKLP